MANIWATKDGNWSDTTVWNLGRLPTNGDVVAANGYTVTIDMDLVGQYAPAAIQTSNIGGTAGGGFSIASNRQIGDANNVINIGGSGSTTTVITIQSGNYNVTFYANVTGGSSGYAYGIYNYSTGTVTVTGNVTGGSNIQAFGILNQSTGTVNVTGNVTGGSSDYAYGIYNLSTGTVNVTGNVTGGSGGDAFGIHNSSTGTVNVTGNVTGGSSDYAYGIRNYSTGTVNVTGNVTGGSNSEAFGILNNSTGTVNVTGNVTGGSGSGAYGIRNNSTGTVTVTGNVVPASSTNAYGIRNYSTGTITINGDVYGGRNQPSVYANNGLIIINGDLRWDETYSNTVAIGTTVNGKIILNGNIRHHYGTTGYYGLMLASGRVLMRNGGNTYTAYAEDDGSGVATGNPVMHCGSMPSETDVRYGTSYGPGDSLTGTCHVPPPESVLYGVPVDNTVGTATIDADSIASAVWGALRSEHTGTGTFGAVSEWAGVGGSGTADWTDEEKKQIRHRLGIDGDSQAPASGVPSLLSAVGYTAARADKLDNLDAAISSRSTLTAADVWNYATRTLSGFAFQVTVGGYTTGQSPSEQLQSLGYSSARAAKLDNLDAAVSSRLAASSYIAPDNASIAAIKSQTDKLSFVGTDVKATLDNEAVIVGAYATNMSPSEQIQILGYTSARAGKLDNLDASVSTRLAATSYVAPDNASIAAIKAQTDKLTFDASNNVYATGLGGGGGSVQVIVQPLQATVQQPSGEGGTITFWLHAKPRASWVVDGEDLTGRSLYLIVYDRRMPNTAIATFSTANSEITVTYDSGNDYSLIQLNGADNKITTIGDYDYVIRDQTNDAVLLSGRCLVHGAPDVP